MLEVWRCSEPGKKQELFARAHAKTDSWVVSDLQSKWHLQKQWLEQDGVLDQSAVLRAGELWRRVAFQLRPDLQVISSELAQSLIWSWLEPKALPWARTPQAVSVVQKQMQMWVSVLAARDYKSVMSEWFSANSGAIEKWGHWFMLCSELWEWFQERNLMLAPWLPGILLNEDLSQMVWPRRLIFDLGPQISLVEGQLIREISSVLDVAVVVPEAPWAALMPETLKPYEPLTGETQSGDPRWQPAPGGHLQFGRFSTQLAEVKDAVAQVRRWLESGVAPDKIALVAPDIEELWPALRLYLEREGIPVNKAVTAKWGGFPEMSRWLGTLRARVRRAKTADLEMMLYAGAERPALPVTEFRRLFTRIYDASDLARAEKLFSSSQGAPQDGSLPLADFLAWALSAWPEGGSLERLEALLASASQEAPATLELPAVEWLSYIEGLLSRREVAIEPAAPKGIWCLSLSSSHWLPLTHGVFLNLNEASLRSLDRSPVSAGEAQKILQDTGFALGPMERQQLEFEMIWFWQKAWSELRLTFASTDFEGQVLTPSRLWMWAAFINEKFIKDSQAPRSTRWDEVQRQPLEALAHGGTLAGLRRDAGLTRATFGTTDSVTFSASGLERFWECPFLFAIEKRWRLSDDPNLDLDLDRASRGRLLHALLQKLTVEPVRFDWSEIELHTIVEMCRQEEKVEVMDERLWPAIRRQHVQLGRLFLEFEREWRAQYPHTQTVGREVKVQGHWDVTTAGPVKAPTGISFSGRIDRIDKDSKGRYALIDYKSSATKASNWRSWLEKSLIQLPFYSLLVEEGFTELPPAPVEAANYFVVKDLDRRKGYHVSAADAELYPVKQNYNYMINEEQKAQLMSGLKEKLNSALMQIKEGALGPEPSDLKTCDRCSWSKQCRAPHLN